MKIINRRIVIIGTSHHNTLSMVRCFGMTGNKVDLILYGCESSFVAASNMVERCHYAPSEEKAYILLLSLYADEAGKPIIISCTDTIAAIVDANYDSLSLRFDFFNAGESGRVSKFMDKSIQVRLAEKVGFKVPYTIPSSMPLDIDSYTGYPYLIKPLESKNGGKKIVICNNEQELQKAVAEFGNIPFLIQQFIKKDKEFVIVGLTVGGVSYIPACIEKHRETSGATTYSTVHPIDYIPASLVDSTESILKTIGYEGLWGVELIKRGEDYYFIELNLRNDATTYSVAVAGVNLPFIYAKLKSKDNTDVSLTVRTIDSIVENRDFQFVLARKIGLIQWLTQYRASECKYIRCKGDMKPFIIERKRIMSSLFDLLLHKLHLK